MSDLKIIFTFLERHNGRCMVTQEMGEDVPVYEAITILRNAANLIEHKYKEKLKENGFNDPDINPKILRDYQQSLVMKEIFCDE